MNPFLQQQRQQTAFLGLSLDLRGMMQKSECNMPCAVI